MRKLVWITDPHLNFVPLSQRERLVDAVRCSGGDAVLVTGDISEADDVRYQLEQLQSEFGLPLLFVLGNHDFYHSTIDAVRAEMVAASSGTDDLTYLTGNAPLMLEDGWAICGDDGWADARCGDYWGSPVRMNDFRLIKDLDIDKQERFRVLKRLAVASAVRIRKQLDEAKRRGAQRLLVATHVPPFRESCWHEGRHTDDTWAPFFVSHAVGWMLRRFCARHPAIQILVLCGHTHSGGTSRIAANLWVRTGAAEYGWPRIESVLDLADITLSDLESIPCDWTFESP